MALSRARARLQRWHTRSRWRAVPLLIAVGMGLLFPAQPRPGFPRTVLDGTGTPVTIPAYPARVALLGDISLLRDLLPPAARVPLDPRRPLPPLLWRGAGLLIAPAGLAAAYPAAIAAAQAAGVPVWRTTPIADLAGWRAALTALGHATGREGAAAWQLRQLDTAEQAARRRAAGHPAPRALILTPEGYTLGQGTLITDLIARAGALNSAAAAGYADIRQIDDAAIRALAPEVLLLTPAWGVQGRAALRAHPAYAALPAVRHGRVLLLPFDPSQIARPGPALLWLAHALHPAPSPPRPTRSATAEH